MKNYSLQTKKVIAPTAFVTKGRQRVKQYDDIVYLKNGDEFEIELFNPRSNKVLAKISLNGNSIGTYNDSGIIVRPGERVFLERYFNETKKFLFETYEVDAKDPNVQEAIKLNGVVDIEFFDEYKQPYIVSYPEFYHYHHYYPYYYPYYQPMWYQPAPITVSPVWLGFTASESTANANTYTYSSNTVSDHPSVTANYDNINLNLSTPVQQKLKKETGRIEKGSVSDQSFIYDSTTFKSYCDWKCVWKILPESQKALVKEDLKVFCPNCRSKRKKSSHKFCPNCGCRF